MHIDNWNSSRMPAWEQKQWKAIEKRKKHKGETFEKKMEFSGKDRSIIFFYKS